MGHFLKVCSACEKMITQCRCKSPDKTKTFELCDECKKKNNIDTTDGSAILSPSPTKTLIKKSRNES